MVFHFLDPASFINTEIKHTHRKNQVSRETSFSNCQHFSNTNKKNITLLKMKIFAHQCKTTLYKATYKKHRNI